jgi:hypothetical protein
MSWNVTNGQADPMQFTLDDGTVHTAAGGATVALNSGIASIVYHRLNYVRNGIWPFPDNQALNATYGGQQNCYVRSAASTEAVYPYTAP